jgi:hypothetical protein
MLSGKHLAQLLMMVFIVTAGTTEGNAVVVTTPHKPPYLHRTDEVRILYTESECLSTCNINVDKQLHSVYNTHYGVRKEHHVSTG